MPDRPSRGRTQRGINTAFVLGLAAVLGCAEPTRAQEGYFHFYSYCADGVTVTLDTLLYRDSHGAWTTISSTGYYCENGQKNSEGGFLAGQMSGVWTFWHLNGQVSSLGSYQNGAKEGEWTEWYTNGVMKARGPYLAGQKEGVWREWGEDGVLLDDLQYEADVLLAEQDRGNNTVSTYIMLPTDHDEDGMADQWERSTFGSDAFDATGDNDGDGASNWQEYMGGTDPMDPGSVMACRLAIEAPGRVRLLWSAQPGVSYVPQYCDGLASNAWVDMAAAMTATNVVGEIVDPLAPAMRTYRVRVLTLPDAP